MVGPNFNLDDSFVDFNFMVFSVTYYYHGYAML